MTLLEVKNLAVTFDTETGPVEAVRGVSFSLGRELSLIHISEPTRPY